MYKYKDNPQQLKYFVQFFFLHHCNYFGPYETFDVPNLTCKMMKTQRDSERWLSRAGQCACADPLCGPSLLGAWMVTDLFLH